MRKLSAYAFGGLLGVALSTAALSAAVAKTNVMNVALPDGSVVHVEYVGNIRPKVTLAPPSLAGPVGSEAPFASFAGFERMIDDMNRQTEALLRQAQEMARQPASSAAATPSIASFGNIPPGQTSTIVVSVSDGGSTCSRTTQVVSGGPGKPPKVTSSASGQCTDRSANAGAVTHNS